MKHKKTHFSSDVDLNMTPMIDVTFLLIIFFMVVSEISRLEVDKSIQLPHLDERRLDDSPEPGRLVLNVDRNGVVKAFGRRIGKRELQARLRTEADTDRSAPGEPSNRPVFIRADKRVAFEHIEKILYYCVQNNIRIWKVSFGAAGGQEQNPVKKRSAAKADEKIELQMTPMIDVVFLLLIFFMCATKFKQLEGRVDAFLPKDVGPTTGQPPPNFDPIIIQITGSGSLKVNGKAVAGYRALLNTLDELKKLTAKPKVILNPDRGAQHERVMKALEVCKLLGIYEVAFRAPQLYKD